MLLWKWWQWTNSVQNCYSDQVQQSSLLPAISKCITQLRSLMVLCVGLCVLLLTALRLKLLFPLLELQPLLLHARQQRGPFQSAGMHKIPE